MPTQKNLMLPRLAREVDLRAETADTEKRTVEVIWTTGARVRRRRFFAEDVDEELVVEPGAVRLERLNSGAPFLDAHNAFELDGIIGVVEPGSARIVDGRGVATVRFSERAEAIFRDIQDGIIRQVSVGYQVHKYEVEKRDGEPELWRAVDWEPLEISAVPVAADPGAHIRSDAALAPCVVVRGDDLAAKPAAQPDGSRMTKHDTPVAGEQGDLIDTLDKRGSAPNAAPPPAPAPAPTPMASAPQPNVDEVRREERERIAAIQALGKRFKLDEAFVDDLVARGVSVPQARDAVLRKLEEQDSRGVGHTQISMPAGGLDATVTRREALAEAILHRAAPTVFQLTDRAKEYRGMSLVDVARDCLETAGTRTRGMTANEVAYTATRAAGYHSTSDFPLILAAVAGKRLRQAYASTPRTFEAWTRGITATDFKPMYPTQVGNFPTLKPVAEGAEFSYGTIAEGRETYKLATFGRIVALTRQAIVNDDLRAFDRALSTAGQRAADLESALVYAELTSNPGMADGFALFSAEHSNVITSVQVTEQALAEAWEIMAGQKDLGGEDYIAARPRFILVPPGPRAIEARKLMAQTTPAKPDDVNPFAGSLQIIEEPRLFGTSAWYLAADPNLIDTIEYARLEGQTEPFLDQRVGFELDGVEFKVRHDFAAKALDWRGLLRSAD
jgi:phage head maturation protease